MESRMRNKVLSKKLGKTLVGYTPKLKKKWKVSYSDIDERVIKIIEDLLTSGKPIYHIPRYVSYNVGYHIDTYIK